MAITLATYKLESCIWYHFVRIGVLHLTPYSLKKSGMAITLAKYKLGSSSWCHFVRQMILNSKL
jgi:hypothetical protein